ncbi:chlorhexidine efflux transporter [Pseudoalteromonas espejiana]
MDIGVTLFVTCYAFTFNLVYDHTRAYVLASKNKSCNKYLELSIT